MKRGHVPMRLCLGCGERAPQGELLRIVWDSAAGLTVDPGRRLPGRGGYLHRRSSCWEAFARRKGVVRSLRRTVERAERIRFVGRLRQVAES